MLLLPDIRPAKVHLAAVPRAVTRVNLADGPAGRTTRPARDDGPCPWWGTGLEGVTPRGIEPPAGRSVLGRQGVF